MEDSIMYGADECLCDNWRSKGLRNEVIKAWRELKIMLYRGSFDMEAKRLRITWLSDNLCDSIGDLLYKSDNYFEIIKNNVHPDDKVLTSLFVENLTSKRSFTREYRLAMVGGIYRTFTEYVVVTSRKGKAINFVGSMAPIVIDINHGIKHDAVESRIRDRFIKAEGIFGWRMKDGYIHCNSTLYDLMGFDKHNKKIKLIDFLRAINKEDRPKCIAAMNNVFRQKTRSFFMNVQLKANSRRATGSEQGQCGVRLPKSVCISGLAIDFSKHFNPLVIVGSVALEGSGACEHATERLQYFDDNDGRMLARTRELENELLLTKKAEEQLVANLRKEQELNKVKSLFVNMVSHEMRTPLAIIQGVADLMENCGDQLSDADRKSYTQSIKKSVLRLTRTMDSVLILGKAQSNQLSYQPLKTDIVKFCKNIVNEMEELNEGRKIILQVSKLFPGEIGVDTTLLYHIVSNLLTNAIKYSECDKMVSLKLGYDSKNFTLMVEDQGIGIPQNEIKDMFKLFQRGSNVANRKGIGLGMFIVKHCVSLCHGSIEVKSKENVGTVFKVTLPILT